MSVADIDFDYVAKLRHEYMDVYLDSQMLIEDRIKFAGELPKLLGNFERLLREVHEIYAELVEGSFRACGGPNCSAVACTAAERLRQLASAWPEMKNP